MSYDDQLTLFRWLVAVLRCCLPYYPMDPSELTIVCVEEGNDNVRVVLFHLSFIMDPCYRYLSHFRSVHRGAYFAELRTTTVRKLLPESWGFFCPVHTPDGSPCGLLNHLTADCRVVANEPEDPRSTEEAISTVRRLCVCIKFVGTCLRALRGVIVVLTWPELVGCGMLVWYLKRGLIASAQRSAQILCGLGMKVKSSAFTAAPDSSLMVMLDGKVVGSISRSIAGAAVSHLRGIKAAALSTTHNLTPGKKSQGNRFMGTSFSWIW